jgi:energy-coupling factor transporter ATP-binding protein EcfA2
MTESQKQALLTKCGKVFRPTAALDSRDLFSGRTDQIVRASDAIHTVGQHVVIFGQRGVGKSSLANILRILFDGERDKLTAKINCHKDESFSKLWRNALEQITLVEEKRIGVTSGKKRVESTAADQLATDAGPSDIAKILKSLGDHYQTICIFDEFDRLMQAQKPQQAFAELIKDLSDDAINATIILVGVANDLSGLIQQHASIVRCVKQIQMPRMTDDELKEIVRKAMQELGTSIASEALELIVNISQGLPHYTHLIGRESMIHAIKNKRMNAKLADVKEGVNVALKDIQGTLLDTYHAAVRGQRKGTLFQQVLLACALAEVDEQGFFVSGAVREPMSRIMNETYEITGFSQHLDKFSSDKTRGPVLEKGGVRRKYIYRFIDPLLQPYVIMKGLADGFLEGDLLELLRAKKTTSVLK